MSRKPLPPIQPKSANPLIEVTEIDENDEQKTEREKSRLLSTFEFEFPGDENANTSLGRELLNSAESDRLSLGRMSKNLINFQAIEKFSFFLKFFSR